MVKNIFCLFGQFLLSQQNRKYNSEWLLDRFTIGNFVDANNLIIKRKK